MKRIIALVVCLVLFASSVCYAETEFSLRSNLKFGMTFEDVKQCESEQDVEVCMCNDSEGGYSAKASGLTVAGNDKSSAYYAFDESGGLCSLLYDFESMSYTKYKNDEISSQQTYDLNKAESLSEKLIALYGEPTSYIDYKAIPNGITFIENELKFWVDNFPNRAPTYYESKGDVKSGITIKGIDHWLIKMDGGYVDIQLIHYVIGYGDTLVSFVATKSPYTRREEIEGVVLTYNYLSAETVEEMNDSINNDL